ncbi:MAG: urease accessory protein UreD [Armatimonadetes bacterium]|nr:urease accessory protein UreD [Armatimonadota bacterium]MDW8153317.1 urease accessory protein UreD [Armatimonadota bacterium]
MTLEDQKWDSAGVDGRLRVSLIRRGRRTVIADLEGSGPLRVVRPFPLEEDRILLQLLTVGPGLLAGDRYRVEIRVGEGAKAVVVHPSAAKVHRMAPGRRATQHVRIAVEEAGELEYYPGLGIPYPEAELHQCTEVFLSPGSRFGWFEIWTTGRSAKGEHLEFRTLRVETGIYVGEDPIYRDLLLLVPRRDLVDAPGLLEGARYVASGFWRWGDADPEFREGDGSVLVAGRTGFGDLYLRALAWDKLSLQKDLLAVLGAWRARWGLGEVPWFRYGSGWG